MPAKTTEGDLLDHPAKYIVHQSNCTSKTWAGIACSIFQKYPYSNVYLERRIGKYVHLPGEIYIRGDGVNNRYIINAMAQIYPGKPSNKRFLDFQDDERERKQFFYNCLMQIGNIENLESVAFPYKIGCGLAGGSWVFYEKMINKFADYVEQKAGAKVFVVKRPGD